jgi:quinol monooxygenase YgiN
MNFAKNVEIIIKPEIDLDYAISAMLELRDQSRMENGCLAFEILQDKDEERRFFMWEVFKNRDEFIIHHQQSHTKTFIAKDLFIKIASKNLEQL